MADIEQLCCRAFGTWHDTSSRTAVRDDALGRCRLPIHCGGTGDQWPEPPLLTCPELQVRRSSVRSRERSGSVCRDSRNGWFAPLAVVEPIVAARSKRTFSGSYGGRAAITLPPAGGPSAIARAAERRQPGRLCSHRRGPEAHGARGDLTAAVACETHRDCQQQMRRPAPRRDEANTRQTPGWL